MTNLKIVLLAFMALTLTNLKAQSKHSLIGKWETTYDMEGEKVTVGYEFKEKSKKMGCYTLFVKETGGKKEAYNSVAMTAIRFEDGKGASQYSIEYEGETYNVEAALKLINPTTLEVSYSYYGYSDTEVWKKIE